MNEPKRKTARSSWILADGRRVRLCSGSKDPVVMKLSVWSTSTDYLKQNFESVAADTNFILKCLSLIENNSVFSHELL